MAASDQKPPPPPPVPPPPPPSPPGGAYPGPLLRLGKHPVQTTCPACHGGIVTTLVYDIGPKTHLYALLFCIILCPLMILPYILDIPFKYVRHVCPQCGNIIGTD